MVVPGGGARGARTGNEPTTNTDVQETQTAELSVSRDAPTQRNPKWTILCHSKMSTSYTDKKMIRT